jgi:cellulose synthase/poly-beta-1,6-N-acetylglucosamine synthase-like glycosyltransferase
MSDSIALMQALLGPGYDRNAAEAVLLDALASEVDPLHWCAVHRGIDPTQISGRAAAWAGVQFLPALPEDAEIDPIAPRLEDLADTRMISYRGPGAIDALVSPDFLGVIRLRQAADRNPRLRHRICLVPPEVLRGHLVEAAEDTLIDASRQNMLRFWPTAAAQLDLTRSVRWLFAVGIVLLAALVLIAPFSGNTWLIPVWFVVMGFPTLLRLCALATPVQAAKPPLHIPTTDLPLYSILVPLRDEANMVDQLITSFGGLDYPMDKLQIVFVVESRSPETVAAVERHLDDARFSLIVVPDAAPRTKPKALNFALPFCRGEFVVVYDAEDRPAPDQLRRIVEQFRRQPEVECIQARLVIDNGDEGAVPALFAGEYAGLFAVLLPALARWNAVMPLGGTSNHFRLESLRSLGGWDAFNVTEDADLGVRLARRRLRTATSTTYTLEDAPTRFRPWLGQRTRWLKGWMQTFMVHNRRPRHLAGDVGWTNFFLFEFTILGMLMAPLLHLAFVPVMIWLHLNDYETLLSPTAWTFACLCMLALGFGTTILTNLVGLHRTRQYRFLVWQLAVPFYWLLITWAALLALRDFVRRPFHWFKTPHQVIGARLAPAE